MPLIDVINIKNGSNAIIYVWNITESLEFLVQETLLSTDEAEKYSIFNHENRKKQWLVARLILQRNLKNDYSTIVYSKSGAPELSGRYISISHTKQFVVVMLSDKKCGVDIEEFSDKIGRISNKYLDSNEQSLLKAKGNYVDNLHLAWCVKEAVFKWYSKGGLEFKKDMIIIDFSLKEVIVEFAPTKQKVKLVCCDKKNDGYYLVYLSE